MYVCVYYSLWHDSTINQDPFKYGESSLINLSLMNDMLYSSDRAMMDYLFYDLK